MVHSRPAISVVTPTLRRPGEVDGLLTNLGAQTFQPAELLLVDGAPLQEKETERVVATRGSDCPFQCRYFRQGGGTAVQRNVGIDHATGDFIAFVDDDIRLEPNFFEVLTEVFARPDANRVGGITGRIVNDYLNPATSPRWRWYRRLRVFTTYEPGRYDYNSGYPINWKMHPPHDGERDMDFFSTSCAVWRREVFANGLRFSPFFTDYGVLEDAHFALRAGRRWTLWECGQARCTHLRSPHGRVDSRRLARKTAVNFRFVFMDLVPHRTAAQEYRFWRMQAVDFIRHLAGACRSPTTANWLGVIGKVEGIVMAARLKVGVGAAASERGASADKLASLRNATKPTP